MLLIQYNVKHPLLPLHVDWPLFPLLVELPQPFEQPVRQLHVEQLLLFERLRPPSADHKAISFLLSFVVPYLFQVVQRTYYLAGCGSLCTSPNTACTLNNLQGVSGNTMHATTNRNSTNAHQDASNTPP